MLCGRQSIFVARYVRMYVRIHAALGHFCGMATTTVVTIIIGGIM